MNADVRQLDVVEPLSREALVESVARDFGQIDVLVDNAGLGALGPTEDIDLGFHRLMFETNYWGPYELMKPVLPSMRQRRSGRDVNVTSMGAVDTPALFGPYCATKHALDAISSALDIELKDFGVRVVSVLPGGWGTPLAESMHVTDRGQSAYHEHIAWSREGFRRATASRQDVSPVVRAVIESATADEPPVRRHVETPPSTAPISAALESAHLARRG